MVMLSSFVVYEEDLVVLRGTEAVTWDLFPHQSSLFARGYTAILSKMVWFRDSKPP